LLLVTAALALVLFATTALADTPPPISAGADWKTTVNFYRAMAGLPPLIAHAEEADWSLGGFNHSRYMVEKNQITHEENSALPWYSPEGDAAGRNGNIHVRFATPGPVNCAQRLSVESWIEGPFHASGIVDPLLQKSGFGTYLNGAQTHCGATLDVLRGRSGGAAGPIKFPGPGMTTPVLSYKGGEFPDPLLSCGFGATFQNPSGPAILLMFTATPPATATATLKDNGTFVNACVRDEFSRSELAFRHVVYVMPQFPLVSGYAYAVDIAVGATHYAWTFFACAAGQTGGSCNVPTAVAVRTASAVRTRAGVFVRWRTASEGQTLGFNVYRVWRGKLVKLNRALIPSVFGGTVTGHAYSWLDGRAPWGSTTLAYRLQAVGFDGTRRWVGRAST
jgi:hypothetical protein